MLVCLSAATFRIIYFCFFCVITEIATILIYHTGLHPLLFGTTFAPSTDLCLWTFSGHHCTDWVKLQVGAVCCGRLPCQIGCVAKGHTRMCRLLCLLLTVAFSGLVQNSHEVSQAWVCNSNHSSQLRSAAQYTTADLLQLHGKS